MKTLNFNLADVKKIFEGSSDHIKFVKDEGIYLMGDKPGLPIVYAKNFDPKAFANPGDCFDQCTSAVGGDDFCERLPKSMFANVNHPAATKVKLKVSETRVLVDFN